MIMEESKKAGDLLKQITENINSSSYLITEISFKSFNVAYELGVAHHDKGIEKVCLLRAKVSDVPSDLIGLKRIEYGSYYELRKVVAEWIIDNIANSNKENLKKLMETPYEIDNYYEEEFINPNRFYDFWDNPFGAYYRLDPEGIYLTNVFLPLITKRFNMLKDIELTFDAKIINKCLGWTLRVWHENFQTKPFFMFNYSPLSKKIVPHIFSLEPMGSAVGYEVFEDVPQVDIKTKEDGWIRFTTKIIGSQVSIFDGFDDNKLVLEIDLNDEKYSKFRPKEIIHGNIGFRCSADERALIRSMKIKTL